MLVREKLAALVKSSECMVLLIHYLYPPAPAPFNSRRSNGSTLPSACVCVSGSATRVALEQTSLVDGRGAGLLVCGKAEVSATRCSFERMGAAGEKKFRCFFRVGAVRRRGGGKGG